MIDNTIRSALVTVIKSRRQKMSRAQRQRVIKPQRWLYPYATEARYAAIIRAWLRPMKNYVHSYLKENQEAILRGDSAGFRADSLSVTRLDAVPGKSFKRMIDSLNGWMGQYVPDDDESKSSSPIYMGLGKIADSTFDFNEGQFEKGAKTVLGVEFPVGEDWWPFARDIWAGQNYDLIKSDMKNYIGQVNVLTEKAVTSGLSVKELTKQIQALDEKITKGRANFIARDQIGKLNGQISQRRMESIGLTMYIWETSGDERVRASHEMIDGLLCRWDDPTVYSEDGGKTWIPRPSGAVLLYPGMDYQCRCTAIAYWQELVGEADELLDYEAPGTVEGEVKRGLEYYKGQEKRRATEAGWKNAKKAKKPVVPVAPSNAAKPTASPPTKKPEAKKAETAAEPKQMATGSIEKEINSKLSELQKWGKETKREQASMMAQSGKVLGSLKGTSGEVSLTSTFITKMEKQPKNSVILMHNHPDSTSFSKADFNVMCQHTSIKEMRVVGSNGKTYYTAVGSGERPSYNELDKYEKEIENRLKQECANRMVKHQLPKGETVWSLYLSERNRAFAERYGWEYKEGKLNG